MSVTATMNFPLPEAQTLPQAPAREDDNDQPSTWEQISGSFRQGVDWQPNHADDVEVDAYRPIMDELRKRGYSDRHFTRGGWGYPRDQVPSSASSDNSFSVDAVWQRVEEERRRDPRAFAQLPKTRKEFDDSWKAAERERQRHHDVIAGRSGWGPWLIGQFGAGLTDPLTLATLPIGVGGGGILRPMLVQGLLSSGIEAVEQPMVNDGRRKLGLPELGTVDRLSRIAQAGGLGAAAPPVLKGLGKGVEIPVRAGYDRLPLGFRAGRAALGDLKRMSDGDVARAFAERVPPHMRTPDERDALAVVERDADVASRSPFVNSYAGQTAHRERMQAEAARIAGEEPAPKPKPAGGRVGYSSAIYDGLKARGLPEHTARGVAAGIHAESRSDPGALGGYKGRAQGIGQWLGTRKVELRRRYGNNPTLDQQLDFLVWELKGGDKGGKSVLAAKNDVEALNFYIGETRADGSGWGFMRPAAGGERQGDLSRGMAALGRGGEDIPVGVAGAVADGGDDALARALAAEQADADLQRMRAEAEGRPDRPDLVELVELPHLRREQFDSDASWRVAQSESDAAALGLDAPQVTRQSLWSDARDRLMADKAGEVPGALWHPGVGPIDVKWGDGKTGLSKIAERHPEVLADLASLIEQMGVKSKSENRVVLQSLDHRAVVRLDYDGKAQTWLLSAYKVEGKPGGKAPAPADYRGAGEAARDQSPAPGADGVIAARGRESKLPPDLALAGRPWPLNADGSHTSGFYRFETERGPVTWDPETGNANGAVPKRTGMTAADVRAVVDPAGELQARIDQRADLAQASREFDDPAGPAAQALVDGMAHDVRAALDAGELGEVRFDVGDGAPLDARSVLARLDDEEAALKALRDCL
ncbi:MAG: hypothetical protein K2W91_04660 [Novosphingobium sp.]|nr:hypothetical protein [Novosphingobium sp.]